MSLIRKKVSRPEIRLRSLLRESGIHYKTYPRLPGSPELRVPWTRVVVLVHRCFFHGCPEHYRRPGSSQGCWDSKLAVKQEGNSKTIATLSKRGWVPEVVWECGTSAHGKVAIGRIEATLLRAKDAWLSSL